MYHNLLYKVNELLYMVSKEVIDSIRDLFESGIDSETIADQYDLSVDEVDEIIDSFDDDEKEEKKSGGKDIDEKMDSGAEGSITSEVVKRTKTLALDIQKAKEEIGDYVYHMFDNSGVPVDVIASFVSYAIEFFIANKDNIEALQAQLETAEDMIQKLWEIADEHSSKERLVREYVLKCATEGTSVDNNFVTSMLAE